MKGFPSLLAKFVNTHTYEYNNVFFFFFFVFIETSWTSLDIRDYYKVKWLRHKMKTVDAEISFALLSTYITCTASFLLINYTAEVS